MLSAESGAVDYCLLATGSEVALAANVADTLRKQGAGVRLISMPSWELFEQQDAAYQSQVLDGATHYVSIEAQSTLGWHKYIGRDGLAIGVDDFGISAPATDIANEYGLTPDLVLARIQTHFA